MITEEKINLCSNIPTWDVIKDPGCKYFEPEPITVKMGCIDDDFENGKISIQFTRFSETIVRKVDRDEFLHVLKRRRWERAKKYSQRVMMYISDQFLRNV